ncbi:hypothetical protein ACP8WV_22940, partial [Escherichia coli]
MTKNINFSRFALSPYITGNSGDLLASIFMPHLPSGVASDSQYVREGANKQVISSQADSLIKISRIWADFFPANTS